MGLKLAEEINTRLKIKCRGMTPGNVWRSARHCASATDVEEAYQAGQAAVAQAVSGHANGKMITLERKCEDPYLCETGLADLEAVANHEKHMPRTCMNADGNYPTQELIKYVQPLVRGESPLVLDENGLPRFASLRRECIPQRLRTKYERRE